MEISFQIPYHDWKILKKSFPWLLVEKQLREIRNKYIQPDMVSTKESEKNKLPQEISIKMIDHRIFLAIGGVSVEIEDYKIVSSGKGDTELTIMLKGKPTIFDLSTSLEE